ncbi:MAG: endonuclease/exonuclease/phosphatase family protein, partial [Bacteroidota bacterium]
MSLLFSLGFILLAGLSFVPNLPWKHWIARGPDFFRMPILAVQSLVWVAAVVLFFSQKLPPTYWEVAGWIALLIGMIFQMRRIYPYTPFCPKETTSAKAGPTISVLIANVWQHNQQFQPFLDLVRQHKPDLFLTMESDENWQHHLNQLETHYSHSVKVPLDNLYGMHMYSRLPIRQAKVQYLVESDVPSIRAEIMMDDEHTIVFYGVHPAPPSPTENVSSKERDAELMLIGISVREESLPTLVCGDLNDVAWSQTTRLFRKLSGLLDPRIGRGLYPTFHARYPLIRFPMDHLFHSPGFRLIRMLRLPAFGSDHFGMYYELTY